MLHPSQVNHEILYTIRQGSLQIWLGADIRKLPPDHRTVTTGRTGSCGAVLVAV